MMSNIFVGLSVKSSINQPLKNSSLFRHSQCAHRLILTGTDKSGYQEFLIQGVIKEASNAGVNTLGPQREKSWRDFPLCFACWGQRPQAPLNAEFHSGYASDGRLWPWPAYRWPWSFSCSFFCSSSIFSSRSTLAFAVKSSRISSRERRYSA